MREKTIYIADDGKEFATKDECMSYEIRMIDTEKLIEATKTIHDICNMFGDCEDCPLRRAKESTCRFNYNHAAPPCEAWDFDDME
jgi:hypothetical protein